MTDKRADGDCRLRSFERLANAWTRSIGGMIAAAIDINRAAMSAFGEHGRTRIDESTSVPWKPLSTDVPDWEFHRSVDAREEITIDDFVQFSKTITTEDVQLFATISGDTNPLHLDESFAAGTRFGEPIAHGTLISGLISAALARLPGLTIYLSQDLQYLAPVEVGDTLVARCEVVEVLDDDRFRLRTTVRDETETLIIDGEAVVLVDEPPTPTEDD